MLTERSWNLKYTPDDGDLVQLFYVPALQDAVSYDRLTGYFSAGALALAARGIEGLVRNDGHMRLVVGCTLEQPEIEAIESGERLRETVERRLSAAPLTPVDAVAAGALELLSWMIARNYLSVRVAVPCTADRTPIPSDGIFHEKAGIVQGRCRTPNRLERKLERDPFRLAAQLGEHQRLYQLGNRARTRRPRRAELRAALGRPLCPGDSARCTRGGAPRSDAVHA